VATFGEEMVTNISQILMQSGRDIGFVVHKRNRVDRFCRLSTMHECDRQTDKKQTDRLRNGNINRNSRNRLSEISPNNTICIYTTP